MFTFLKDTEVLVNARKEAGLIDPETGHYIELDFFIPALMLAFEFQERHHYVHSEFVTKPLEEIKHRDKIKHDLAKQSGISLITIPCWWDGRLDRYSLLLDRSMRSPSRLKLFLQLDIYHQEAPTGSGSGHASHHRRPNTRGASATLFRKTGTASRRCRRTHHRLLLHFIQY